MGGCGGADALPWAGHRVGGMARASYASITEWMILALNPDFVLPTRRTCRIGRFGFPRRSADDIAAIAGCG